MFTSWSEVSTPAELSMASVLMRTPAREASTRPSWVNPRLPPSPTTRTRRSAPLMRIASLALSPALALVSDGGLDVGADPSVPEQVDGGTEDGPHQLVAESSLRCPPGGRAPWPLEELTGTDLRLRG